MNGFLITGSQFLSYLINLASTKVPGTWRWMLGLAGLPALIQFMVMLFLPESPRWLFREVMIIQVAQQFVGIKTVMYYEPIIVQFAGFASNSVALVLFLVTSGLNAGGSIMSMLFVDRYRRRRLMIISVFGIIFFLVTLAFVFQQASTHSPHISPLSLNDLELTLLVLLIWNTWRHHNGTA